jgi:ankyrin repeat protein
MNLVLINGKRAKVKLLLVRDDVEADLKDMYGRSPLSCAAQRGQDTVVKQIPRMTVVGHLCCMQLERDMM